MVVIEAILAFILLVGILVFVHEMGHFLAARMCGIRADVFAVGMGPRLFGWNRKTGFTFGKLPENLELGDDTDYRLSAFPIGGYVKIAGMVDESFDTDFAGRPPQPWEFRSKNTLQKAFVICAGVIMNFLLAILLFAGLAIFYGVEGPTPVVGRITQFDAAASAAGIHTGDTIAAINGVRTEQFTDFAPALLAARGKTVPVEVRRGGAPVTVQLAVPADSASARIVLPEPREVVILDVTAGGPAEKSGLQIGDTVLAINGIRTTSPDSLVSRIRASNHVPMQISVQRGGEMVQREVSTNESNVIGVTPDAVLRTRYRYGLIAGLGEGVTRTWETTAGTFGMVGRLISGEAKLKESVAGPTKIAEMAQRTISRDFIQFLVLMGIISISLACMNILPFPALDGGHLVFIIIEGIIRREVPMKVRMVVQQVGVFLLLGFFVFIFYNDISNLFKK